MPELSKGVQQVLWHETLQDALGTCVDALNGKKAVGKILYPLLSPSQAEQKVRSNLNPERDHDFKASEVELIGSLAMAKGCFALQEYLARSWGCEFKQLTGKESRRRRRKARARALMSEFVALLNDDDDEDEGAEE